MTLLSGVASINEIGTELRVFDAPNGIFADTLKIGWAAMPRKGHWIVGADRQSPLTRLNDIARIPSQYVEPWAHP
jgi:hypothetical protein